MGKLAIAASLRDLLNIPGDQNVLSVPSIPTPRKPMSQEMPKEKSKEMSKEMSNEKPKEMSQEIPKEMSKEKPKDMSQKMSHEMPQVIKDMSNNTSEIGTSMKNGNGRSHTLKDLKKRMSLYKERQKMQKWKMDSQSILKVGEKTPEKE